MKPPFEVNMPLKWYFFRNTGASIGPVWLLTHTQELKDEHEKYGAIAFKPDMTEAEIALKKAEFAEYLHKHGINVNF